MAVVINRNQLEPDGNGYLFHGKEHGGTSVSFIYVDNEPGGGPRLHQHGYDEVFVILEGNVTFTVGGEEVKASAGDVVVGPANVPHKFVNDGPGALRQVDIHATDHIVTEWLE